MSRWNPHYPPSRPRPVEGGLKARTARGAIGSSWWSHRFLDVLESFAMGNRLTRGRTYARKGQVISLDVTRGQVHAAVQGSRAKPYRVSIGLAPFPELVWAKAEIALSEQALPSAKLLAREVPPELEQIFTEAGAPLFPRTVNELDQRCSCPDWEVPCKHLAATFYLLAEAFDDDPFLILRWRGREREPLLARLRELRSGTPAPPEPHTAALPQVAGAELALVDLAPPSAEPERFWLLPPPLPPRPAMLDVDPALLLRQLPAPAAAIGGQRLVEQLRLAYQRFPDAAE
jgi:uncharacterized Zn finger protein